ncbi:Aurofusarin biosynthesis regulatory protein aurR1 [Cladobotryum mycophilum]|uniref:Aurofusarin biosynthesis regulatory protein aurR1 n=1 Tax=Cladobotryum mycophilum TaxID=491253 RepID=A0ABR0S8B6_9HYPO
MNMDVLPTPRRPETFRASCDNCAKSKVRCGKQQPRCQRCIQRGTVCGYSLSQRSRKRTHSAPMADGQSQQQHLPQHQSGHGSDRATPTPGDGNSPISLQPTTDGLFVDLESLTNGGGSTDALGSAAAASFSWLSEPITSVPKDLDMTDMLSLAEEVTLGGGTPSGFGSATTVVFEDHKSPGGGTTGSSSTGGGSNGSPVQHHQHHQHHHHHHHSQQHCSSALLSTLQDLGIPSASCTGGFAATQSLGTVLKASRSALDGALNVASCSCTPNANVALLVTSVVFRILCWYDAILQSSPGSYNNGCNNNNNNSDSSAASTDGDEADDLSGWPRAYLHGRAARFSPTRDFVDAAHHTSSNGPGVYVPPITIGAYELDVEDQARMIVHIVLSELAKMNRLLDGFSKKFCRKGSASLGEDNKSQLHVALEMFLRNKHSLTVLAAREKLDGK